MSKTGFKVGQIIENEVGQFTKIISFSDGRYGLGGWTRSQASAKDQNIVFTYINIYGLTTANAKVVGKTEEAPEASDDDNIELGKYLVTGEIFPLNEDGTPKDTALELHTVHEIPTAVGDGYVTEGKMLAVPNKSSLAKLSVDEVKAQATALGLSVDGNKGDVLERLYTLFEI